MARRTVWPRWALLVILAIGVAVVWGTAAGVIISQWESNSNRGYAHESLSVRASGEPVIDAYTTAGGVYRDLASRDLDGKAIAGPRQASLAAANLVAGPRQRRWYDGPVTWRERLMPINEEITETTHWYFLHDGSTIGRAYLQGFDRETRFPVGYIGRNGFHLSPPAPDQQFETGPAFDYFGSHSVVTLGGIYSQFMPSGDAVAAPPWCVYVLDRDRVLEINLRDRQVKELLVHPEIRSLSLATQPRKDDAAVPTVNRLVIRLPDRLVVVNPADGEQAEFSLPKEFQSKQSLTAYVLDAQQLLIESSTFKGRSQSRDVKLTWLNSAGEIAKERTVDLAGYVSESDREGATIFTLAIPSPLAFAVMTLLLAPMDWKSRGLASHQEAVREILTAAWPPGAVLLVACLTAAWLVVRWQRRYDRSHTALWAITVFLLGVPGLLAYMIYHGFPPRAPCPACGAIVPRRRDACAACRAPFPAPALKGTEVFA